MRAFIAVELPQNITDLLVKAQGILQKSQADVKWVARANLHLTLKFLGDINEEEKDKIINIIKTTSQEYTAFESRPEQLGAFPKEKYPRVIWASLNNENQLKKIAQDLEERINKLGIPKEERSFKAHITIGRVKSSKNLNALSEALSENSDFFRNMPAANQNNFVVQKITLFKSTLLKDGPLYEKIYEENLKTT